MTREEARLYADSHMGIYGGKLVDEIVQTIYDDFESRTCENCSNLRTDKNKDVFCNKIPWSIFIYDYALFTDKVHHGKFYVDKDFGCNKFELKDKK